MKTLLILCTLTLTFSSLPLSAQVQQRNKRAQKKQQANDPPSYVDMKAFEAITQKAKRVREDRLVDLDAFLKMAKDPKTIVLDTRSQWAFDTLHIKGAKHLNFSDFTDEKLKKTLGSNKDVRILIYCNNNFFSASNLPGAVATKAVGLALNIPTFINLYGYGYENVYELGVGVDIDDKRLPLVRKK